MIYIFITSLCYLLLISIIYFSKEKIDNVDNKIYSIVLIVNIVGILLDIIQFLIIRNGFPDWMIIVVGKIFLVYILSWTSLFCSYTISISEDKSNKLSYCLNIIKRALLIIGTILVLTLPLSYYHNGNEMYTNGLAVNVVFVFVSLYILIMLISCINNLKNNKKRIYKYIPLVLFLITGTAATLVQYINPTILLTSPCETFVTILTYFFIENPDVQMLRAMETAKNEAEKANRAKSDFLSSMSHEIRTPLNAIVGFSEDIQGKKEGLPEVIIEDANYIMEASQTLLEIIGNILDINKIESNKMEIVDTVYNFKHEMETLAKIDSIRIGEKPITFKVNIAEDIPYELYGDKAHIKEVVNNLLSNAFKYTEKGEVDFTCKCINNRNICNLFISVRDTGRGIKAENINRLFSKFDRLDVERNTTVEGTGLGLAITKKLVELMGGKINVQSTYGVGSMFMVQLPQKIATLSAPVVNINIPNDNTVQKVVNIRTNVFEGKRVLIVDDNKLNIKVARRALNDFNFVLDECYDGVECLNKVKNGNEYDLILMDIMMPNMGGEATLAKLRENPNFKIPTIALTADALTGAQEKYVSQGFTDYIAKPFSKDQIKEKLDIVFNNTVNVTNKRFVINENGNN